jgi:hypothetical protein
MGDVADVSEVHAASIFMVEICSLVNLCEYTVYRTINQNIYVYMIQMHLLDIT